MRAAIVVARAVADGPGAGAWVVARRRLHGRLARVLVAMVRGAAAADEDD